MVGGELFCSGGWLPWIWGFVGGVSFGLGGRCKSCLGRRALGMIGMGYLDEITIQREDQQLYKFVEGDFPRLNLRDIEDMLLLLVQKKLSNLERDDLFGLNVALRMPESLSTVTAHSHLFEGFFMILLPAWRWITCKKRGDGSKNYRKGGAHMSRAIDQTAILKGRLPEESAVVVGGRE
ncbi:hypothetical protein Tco_1024530 [Tanacetum coccineum]